jgi:hypothetical protein
VPNRRGSEFSLLDASLCAPHLGVFSMNTVPHYLGAALIDWCGCGGRGGLI